MMTVEREHYIVFLVYITRGTEILGKDFPSFDRAQEYMHQRQPLVPY
ncbi:hypothetical protein LCGC14_1366330, partial [marine sediment metagenome]